MFATGRASTGPARRAPPTPSRSATTVSSAATAPTAATTRARRDTTMRQVSTMWPGEDRQRHGVRDRVGGQPLSGPVVLARQLSRARVQDPLDALPLALAPSRSPL